MDLSAETWEMCRPSTGPGGHGRGLEFTLRSAPEGFQTGEGPGQLSDNITLGDGSQSTLRTAMAKGPECGGKGAGWGVF